MSGPRGWGRLLRVADAIETVVVAVGRTAAWLTLPLVAVIMFDAVCRKFFRHLPFVIDTGLYHLMNSPKLQDFEWHLHTMLFFLVIGYAYARNAHVRLDIFRPHLGPRARIWVELVGGLVLLVPFLVVLLVFSFEFVRMAWELGEISQTQIGLGYRWAIKAFVLAGFGTMLLMTAAVLMRALVYLVGPRALRPHARLDALVGDEHSPFAGGGGQAD